MLIALLMNSINQWCLKCQPDNFRYNKVQLILTLSNHLVQASLWQQKEISNRLTRVWCKPFSKLVNLVDVLLPGSGLRFVTWCRNVHYQWGNRKTQCTCAQQACTGLLYMPSLLHWAESNSPFFEYFGWEWRWRMGSGWRVSPRVPGEAAAPLIGSNFHYPGQKNRKNWDSGTLSLRTHLLALLSWLPSSNWHIPLLIIKVMWHMHS